MRKQVLAISCALGALAMSGGARAAAAAADSSSSDQGTSAATVSEIIVTAERREANIQTVPVAITAFPSEERNRKGIITVQDMTNFTPGFTYSSQLDRPVMRGLARNTNGYTVDSAVAIYFDDFFSSSTFLVGRDDMLIDDVQILLGPQGTLYGRNAVAGLINTISKRPTDEWSGEVRAIIGNYGYVKTEGTVSGPIADHLTFRLSFYDDNQTRGWLTNLAPGVPAGGGIRHDPYVDAQLEYKTDKDDLWLDVWGASFNNDRGGPGSLLGLPLAGPYDTAETTPGWLVFNPNFPYSGDAVPGSVVGMVVPGNPAIGNIRDFANAVPTDINARGYYQVLVHWTHHFAGFDVKYVGGYSQYRENLSTDAFQNDNSPITQYTFPLATPGPGNPNPFGSSCAAANFFGQPCAPLTIFPASTFNFKTRTKWTSQEVTFLSTTGGPVQWLGGVYFYSEADDNPESWTSPLQAQIAAPVSLAGGPAAPNPSRRYLFLDYQDDVDSLAGYAQADWKVTPTIKLTGGLRYTFDWKRAVEEARYIEFSNAVGDPADLGTLLPAVDITAAAVGTGPGARGVTCPIQFPTTGPYAGDATRCLGDHSSGVTGTAGIAWTPDPRTLVYLRYNHGYKAFALNAGPINDFPEAKPETLDDIEGGLKKTFGATLVLDADAFYYRYANDQIPITAPTNAGISLTEFVNIPRSISDGIEFSATWTPVERLNFTLSYGFNHTEITSRCTPDAGGDPVGACFPDAIDPGAIAPGARPVGNPIGASLLYYTPDPLTGFVQTSAPIPNRLQAVNGDPLPQAPQNKIGFNAEYTIPFQAGNLIVAGTLTWRDKSYADIFTRAYYLAPSWDQVDLRLTWSGHHDRYEVVGYVKNLFNTLGYDAAGGFSNQVAAPQGVALASAYGWATSYDLTPPRLYGVELHYKF